MDSLEELFRTDHERLWKSLLAFTGSGDLAAEAEAEAYAQALARGDAIVDLRAWVWSSAFRIASGLLADRRARTGVALASVEGGLPLVGDLQIDSSLAEFVDQLHGLSDQQRLVVVLRYAARLTPTEIATVLGTSPGTVRVQLHRAHKLLQEEMGRS